jgi:Domain of unknown function (DUF4704)
MSQEESNNDLVQDMMSSKPRLHNSNATVSHILHVNQVLSTTEQNVNHMDVERDQEAWLLYKIFEGFCSPTVGRARCSSILEMEREQRYTIQIPLPDQPVIVQIPRQFESHSRKTEEIKKEHKCPVVCMLQSGASSKNMPVILQLPIHFSAAFIRILIRLISHESDTEYNEACLLSLKWKDRCVDGVINLKEDPLPDPDHATRRPHLQYSVARFQCTWQASTSNSNHSQECNEERPTIVAILSLWERVSVAAFQFERLVAPLSRLIGLLATAGVAPTILRRMMVLISQQQTILTASSQTQQMSQQIMGFEHVRGHSVYSRLCLTRALKTAAAGASRSSLLPKSVPSHYFSFGGGVNKIGSGMQRTINGLSVWPFRNDFGMALWFRAECFPSANKSGRTKCERIVLFSVLTDEGGGIEISLVPIDNDASLTASHVRTIAVSIYDSDFSDQKGEIEQAPTHHIKARGGCVLLPQVWYHVSVRHTRSRLKGVFSLATRQQLSIMLDGKAMLTEPLNFPQVTDVDFSEESYYSAQTASSLLKNSFRKSAAAPSSLNITLTFGQNLEGQTGALYVFNDNVSDASFRSLYELTGGSSGVQKRMHSLGDSWDSRHSDIVRKSRVLDVNISIDDADDIVLSQRRFSGFRKKILAEKLASVIDFGEGDEQDEPEIPAELQKAAFGSKIFISWNPRRVLNSVAIELHVGAHVAMHDVYAWRSNLIQEVIGSLGGIQSLIPLFRSFLAGDIERSWSLPHSFDLKDNPTIGRSSDHVCTIIPDLIRLLASFVQDHGDNARELLRCGGIDVIEQLFYTSRKIAVGKGSRSSIFGAINSHPGLSYSLIEALLSLRSACSHYVGLETKVYSRLLFNIPLWLGGFHQIPGVALHVTLLPVLSSLTKLNPQKVRDCVGIKDMVQALKEYNFGIDFHDTHSKSLDLDRFTTYELDERSTEKSLSSVERRHATNILLAMIFIVLSRGTSPVDLSPFLHLISHNLETAWEDYLLQGEKNGFSSNGNEIRIVACACSVLQFLMQIRPCVPGLYESFADCCGGVQNGAGWILCSLVNSHNDEIRGLGIRCLARYLDVVSRGADMSLSLGSALYPTVPTIQSAPPVPDVTSMVRRSSSRFTQLAKGLAAMSPGVRLAVHPPSRLTERVVYKVRIPLQKS